MKVKKINLVKATLNDGLRTRIAELEAELKRVKRDLADVSDFTIGNPLRCKDCKRLYPSGYLCPHCGKDN